LTTRHHPHGHSRQPVQPRRQVYRRVTTNDIPAAGQLLAQRCLTTPAVQQALDAIDRLDNDAFVAAFG
jgi:hypothetical protein